ncbi:hypothetical protein J8I87_31115 [Paraburkholderia sp. LEh10]|uniref:hypothetical protein n=1 Tax=Paraburkholderia sp. LEh10 TaxID=2821353 RepID=UPI001AEA4F67|nr:hypothetical protein [Paraburkholderia sp. LEh10]MBP0594049.1 hypothetical protein [Paraburkholderia sp. LEh10]
MDLEEELGELCVADKHIARGLELVEQQRKRVRALDGVGYDSASATRLLVALQASLDAMAEHRAVIQETIAMIRSGLR